MGKRKSSSVSNQVLKSAGTPVRGINGSASVCLTSIPNSTSSEEDLSYLHSAVLEVISLSGDGTVLHGGSPFVAISAYMKQLICNLDKLSVLTCVCSCL